MKRYKRVDEVKDGAGGGLAGWNYDHLRATEDQGMKLSRAIASVKEIRLGTLLMMGV
jgi:hypothetical protein